MKRVLYTDPHTAKEVVMDQRSDGTDIIETTQRFDTLIKINKQMNNDIYSMWRKYQMSCIITC
jgi:hypothetical protein